MSEKSQSHCFNLFVWHPFSFPEESWHTKLRNSGKFARLSYTKIQKVTRRDSISS